MLASVLAGGHMKSTPEMQSFEINWRVDTTTRSAEKAGRVCSELASEVGHALAIDRCEPHHENPLHQSYGTSRLEARSVQEAVYTLLRDLADVSGRCGGKWEVHGPFEYPKGVVELDVYFTAKSIPGLHYVHVYFRHDPAQT